MRKLVLSLALVVLIVVTCLKLVSLGQRPDSSFDARVARPAYTSKHPVVLFDEGHYNSHSLRSGFRAFGELLRNDGYAIEATSKPFTAQTLAGVDVVVIVNAAGGSNPKLLGLNLVPLRKGRREAPAFGVAEVAALRQWVANGGSLLLVADHYPFGPAAAGLAETFGVTMHGGFAEVPAQNDSNRIVYSRANALLADTPIAAGRNASERLEQVVSFTGQSLDVRNGTPLLKLPAGAIEYVPPPPRFTKKPAGTTQAAAIEFGRGRVVVIGEAGMLTAQIAKGERFGMNVPGNDNRQFVLNLMHWLSRVL